jgi:ribonucleoside-diphosphate reductase beta chain
MPIQFDSFPLKLFHKGRALAWDPLAYDFAQDRQDWATLSESEQEIILRTVIGFLIGERAVAHDLAPLQQALRRERGRMEEEMFLTQQQYEEANHVEFFQNWMNEVLPGEPGRDIPLPPLRNDSGQGRLLANELPAAMQALREDTSPETQMRAAVTYHMVVEGVLAEFGYQFFYRSLKKRGVLPGLVDGIHQIQRDEVRHIAFGNFLIQRLIRERPELEQVFDEEMDKLKPAARASSMAFFDAYESDTPFGLDAAEFEQLFEQLYEGRRNVVKRGETVGV